MPTMHIEKLPKARTKVTVDIEPAVHATAQEKALRTLGSRVTIEGFRPGKAPLDILREKLSAKAVTDETIHTLLPNLLKEAMEQHKIAPIVAPRVEILTPDPLKISLLFLEMPEVKINADKIALPPKTVVPIAPQDIDAFLRNILWQDHTETAVDRAVEKTDIVTIHLATTDSAGQAIATLSNDRTRVIVGESSLLPEVDALLPGMKKDEEKSVKVVLPNTFHDEALRGKKITCSVKVLEVKAVSLPALTQDYLKTKLKIDKSPDAFRAEIETMLRNRRDQDAVRQREDDLFTQVKAHTKVELADELIDAEADAMLRSFMQRLEQQKMTMEDWMKQTGKKPDVVVKEMKESAKDRLTVRFGTQQLIKLKGITVTDDEITQLADQAHDAAHEQHDAHHDHDDFAPGGRAFEQMRAEKEVEKLMAAYGV